jgi:hypothetical protein
MVKRSFTVRALWDRDANVYYSESDIIGLHIETATLDEFEAVLFEVGPDLILANHMSRPATSPVGIRILG